MERVVAFDNAVRGNGEDYSPVLEALLDYVNRRKGSVDLRFDVEDASLRLRSDGGIRLAITNEWGSNECLLRFMPFRVLKARVKGRLYVGDLQNLRIETLDLRGCRNLVLNQPVDLPHLRRVFLRDGQCDPGELRAVIHSNESFEIVE